MSEACRVVALKYVRGFDNLTVTTRMRRACNQPPRLVDVGAPAVAVTARVAAPGELVLKGERKEVKEHGLSRAIEGPVLDASDRCLIVEDVVTTGGSTLRAIVW